MILNIDSILEKYVDIL